MKKLLLILLLVYPLSALAETYQWTDERGTVHFTEDLGKVPKKYRKNAKLLGSEEDASGSAPKVPGSEESAAPGRQAVEPARPATPQGDPAKDKKLYGGKDESAWRSEFQQVKNELQYNGSEIAALRGRLDDTSKMSRSEYLSIQATIKHAENRMQQARKKLDLLREKADRYGVPEELRQ